MKEFIQKYQKAIVGTGAVSVLLICYFQQKELSKLRSEVVAPPGGPVANWLDELTTRFDPECMNMLQSKVLLYSNFFLLKKVIFFF